MTSWLSSIGIAIERASDELQGLLAPPRLDSIM